MSKKQKSRLEEIDKCLEQDRRLQSFFYDALEKNDEFSELLKSDAEEYIFTKHSEQNLGKLESVYNRLGSRLDRLKNAIESFKEMRRLQRVKRHADLTVAELDLVISHYQITCTTDSIIRHGPTGQLKEHLHCLYKIKRAADYFHEVIPAGPELRALRRKLYAATQQLKSEFSRLLLRCSKPTSPVDILKLMEVGEEVHILGIPEEFMGIPRPVRKDMASIAPWLLEDPSSFELLLDDIDKDCPLTPKKREKRLKTMSLDRDACGSPHPRKNRAASWLNRKFKTSSLDRPSALRTLPQRKENFLPSRLPDITEEEIPLETMSSPNRLKTRSLDRMESPNTFKAPLPGSPFVRKKMSWMNNTMQTRSLDRHPDLEPIHSPFRGKPLLQFNIFTGYSNARSCWLSRSFKGFKDHLSKRIASSTSLRSSSLPSSSPSSSRSSSSSSSSSFARSSLRNSLSRIFKRLGKEGWCDIDVDFYSQCINAFVLLAEAEWYAVREVFPDEHRGKVFDQLIQKTFDALIEDGEYILFAARHAVNNCRDYGTLLSVLQVIQDLKVAQYNIYRVLRHTSDETQEKLLCLAESMEAFVLQALDRYLDGIKEKQNRKREMPEDGTVHELASNVILFLSQLVQMKATLAVFSSREPSRWRTFQNDSLARMLRLSGTPRGNVYGVEHLRVFIYDVLEQLCLTLENMAEEYEDAALKAIFLLNNSNYIHNAITKAQLSGVWVDSEDSPQAVWKSRTEEQKQKYLQSWMKVTEFLSDDGVPPIKPGSKPKQKVRHMIKAKFTGFNEGIEELVGVQEGWTVPDQALREDLRQELLSMVGQAYGAFLQRYKNVKFTTHPQKYHKYSFEEIEEKIQKLFQSLI